MTVKTLVIWQASPCQPFFPLPGRLKGFSRGVCACGVPCRRTTWLVTLLFTHRAWVAWHLHCCSSRGHCWRNSFAFKPQSSSGLSTTPVHTFKMQETSAVPSANFGNGLSGIGDNGWALKGQKLKTSLHHFIKSRRWQKAHSPSDKVGGSLVTFMSLERHIICTQWFNFILMKQYTYKTIH